MDGKIIRFVTSPRTARKINTIFPKSKYYNKLYNALKIFTQVKNFQKKYNPIITSEFSVDDITMKEINGIFIRTQCELHNLPFKLSTTKFIETDYLEPYWDDYSIAKSPKYIMISKEYFLININKTHNIIELDNLEKFKENQKKVKIYNVEIPEGFKIL